MKEENCVIAEGIYVPCFEKHLGGRNSNPNDALDQLKRNPALVGLRVATVIYNMTTGIFSRSAWQDYKREQLPAEMVRYDYYPLKQGEELHDALNRKPGHYLWDIYWGITSGEYPDYVGIVVQRVMISPSGEELCKDEPFVLRAFGQPCGDGEYSMPAGLQTSRITK